MARGKVKTTYEFSKIKFDEGKFTKTFNTKAETLIRMCARAWLRAVILDVKVWTGFALGSIKFARGVNGNLAKFLNVAVPISPRANYPRFYFHSDGRKVPKTPERGGVFGHYTFPSAQWRYRFTFRSDVVHFILNEFYKSNSPTSPWHSMLKGRQAFKEYFDAHVKDLPHIKDWVLKAPDPRLLKQ